MDFESLRILKISHFYSISPVDLVQLSESDVDLMWQGITNIEAQKQLTILSAMDWPNMKKEHRTKMHKDLFEKAYPKQKNKIKNKIDQSEINKLLGVRDV